MSAAEFSRIVAVDTLGDEPRPLELVAGEDERAALARRFGLIAIGRLEAAAALRLSGADVIAEGSLDAAVTQSCVATAEPVPAEVHTSFEIRFRPDAGTEAEVELGEDDMDVVFYSGGAIDIGEAVAETLLLNLDPYPRAPGAEEALKAAGVKSEEEAGPFGALASLRDKLKP